MTSLLNILFVGDVHVKHTNYDDVVALRDRIKDLRSSDETPRVDYVLFAGDVLDSHEKIDTQLLNLAYGIIDESRKLAPTLILVGNHDYINNKQFLTTNHWMNGMKEWTNVTVVDKPIKFCDGKFIASPYVYPGRFVEALERTLGTRWSKNVVCVFAHQEFAGCKMGCVTSTTGDAWDETFPLVVSGHVHDRQRVGSNIIYPGSCLITSFSDSSQTPAMFVYSFSDDNIRREPVETKIVIPSTLNRKIVRASLKGGSIPENVITRQTRDRLKLVVCGTESEIESFKSTKAYRRCVEIYEKIKFKRVFKRQCYDGRDRRDGNDGNDGNSKKCVDALETPLKRKRSFADKLKRVIDEYNDESLSSDYALIFNDVS